MAEPAALSPAAFTRFYAPLAATSLLLTSTNPILAAALARTPDPASSLAGYSVAFALVGVLYSPLLVVQQVAATRLLDGGRLAPVRRFALSTGIVFSFLAFAAAFSPMGAWIFRDVVGVRGPVYDQALQAMALLWPVPLLTGIRALHQGRLLAGHRTRPIAVATGLRTAVLASVAFVLAAIAPGAWLGAAAFTAGLLVETVLVVAAPTDRPVVELRADGPEAAEDRAELLAFSTPLMLNVLLWWSTPLVINAVLARTPDPDGALATFAIVEALAWFVAAPVGQLQHASIALVHGRASHRRCRAWAGALSLVVAVVLAVVALPAVREPLLWTAFRLDPAMLDTAARALPLAALYPLLYGHRQYYQGLFIRAGAPGVVGRGAVLRIVTIVVAAVLLLPRFGASGAAFGVGLALVGLLAEDVYLGRHSHRRALAPLDAGRVAPRDVIST